VDYSKKGVNLSVCAYCNTTLTPDNRSKDHLFPRDRGGVLSNDNKLPACTECNQLKDNLNILEFRDALERIMHFETIHFKKRKSYLIRVQHNVNKIINERGIHKRRG
jgi:5-methylcytosine-specific restriction endonuclease McrA